jgi:hypothetical protein
MKHQAGPRPRYRIDQNARRAICQAILAGTDRTDDLAQLYIAAGYPSMALAIRSTPNGARIHARVILS